MKTVYESARSVLLERKQVIKLTKQEERLLDILDPIKYDDRYRQEFFESDVDLRIYMYSLVD